MLEENFTLNVIYITADHILEIYIWEGLPNAYLQIGMIGMIIAAGAVGPCMPLTSKTTTLDPKNISSPLLV